jgi:hypothetical protein
MLFSRLLKCAERLFHLTYLEDIIMYLFSSTQAIRKLRIPVVLKDSLL